MNRKQFTLGRTQRLKSRKRIEHLFRGGQSFSHFPFRVLYQLQEPAPGQYALQAGFGVSTKHFKRAVHRNRVKRLAREAWRLQKNILEEQATKQQQQLAVFVIYTGNELPDYTTVVEKTGIILKRLCEKTLLS